MKKPLLILILCAFSVGCSKQIKPIINPATIKSSVVKHVILNDGTSNKPDSNTNIWALHNDIKKQQKHLGSKNNIILYYDAGVGHTGFVSGFLGLAKGRGSRTNVLQAYSHLAKNYKKGDKIYLFGFSRGAYQVRVLANLLGSLGIIHLDNQVSRNKKEQIYKHIISIVDNGSSSKKQRWEQQRLILEFIKKYQNKYPIHRNISIETLGVWDTVESIDKLSFSRKVEAHITNKNLSAKLGDNVKKAFHAIALDENRRHYLPVLFCENSLESITNNAFIDISNINECYPKGKTIKEVWFAGDHTAIGGGKDSKNKNSKDNEIKKIAYEWMIKQIKSDKLVLSNYPYMSHQQYNSLVNHHYIYTSEKPAFKLFPKTERYAFIPCGSILHKSILERMKSYRHQVKNKEKLENYQYYRPLPLLTRMGKKGHKTSYPWGLDDSGRCFKIER